MEKHTIDANTAQRLESHVAKYGDRYYPVDVSYDKNVYESTWAVVWRNVFTMIGFWIFAGCHWWGILSLGIVATDALAYYSIACFFFTIFSLAGLLTSGKYANLKKRHHLFLLDKISEFEAVNKTNDAKAKQEILHAAKIKQQADREAEILAAEEIAQGGVMTTQAPPLAQAATAPAPAGDARLIRTAINDARA